jgi:hypothetical protein
MRKSLTPFTLESFEINGLGDTPPPPINSHEKGIIDYSVTRGKRYSVGHEGYSGNAQDIQTAIAGALRPLHPIHSHNVRVPSLFYEGAMPSPIKTLKEARPALREMSLIEKMSRHEARAEGNAGRAERALGNRLASEQKRPSFDAFSWARKKRHSGVRGRSAPLRPSGHLGVRGGGAPPAMGAHRYATPGIDPENPRGL